MQRFEKILEQFFVTMNALQERLSLRWRVHANRRTIIASIVVGVVLGYSYLNFIRPPDQFPVDILVTIPPGESLDKIAADLQSQGVVRSALAFRIIETATGHQRDLRAGDYLFKEPKGSFAVARAVALGAYGLEPMRIRIPEGATTKEMSIIFGSVLQRFNKANFAVRAQPMEGYLFPDTYFFYPNATEETVIEAMRQKFDEKVATIDPVTRAFGRPLEDTVTMASIVEREASNMQDRRMIAGVLWNRLKRGMPLQVDVTFLYTIGKGTFQLTRADLSKESPYNTYVNKGLPPTPIGSPSLDSLTAAVTPIKSDYLYFLADRNGVTHYCKNYACQEANKQRYF
jgi:UPF0755 protein